MRALKNLTRLSLILILFTTLNACKKDSNDKNGAQVKGSYTYAGKTINTVKADYLSSKGVGNNDGTFYIFIYGEEPTDIIQIIFPGTTFPADGTYSYIPDATPGGKPGFRAASVTDAANPGGKFANAGTVTVTKSSSDYKIGFNLYTQAGTANGSYTGSVVSR